ncbi:MAG: hypothetical protein A3G52_03395 [Candidatus Taylorbacteria bacterium RIFCSPLOWO2_12_FULL_43_20]|uniref:GtrA/DPMS transmembrane domain-containing protein n=1 Tax=Candidatus Taylorbacteria bacterium RIFCSPLOWO2_12_FULL_43_20 TaxID=1802332 RepID=A0A1G2P0P7_9BACT|nr:MAG: hypothetical protein A2825_02340 [Candidatus Taylorbacteria bacterium RIFCSPHIGHO2_01_FULL_43_120]OHA22392.1 MAG: hypothetical protein A3B98_02240 [Candidatus Taylorbacteria bacterium RIFCSPHIGHO2_02_FULL_43_55]OHA28331.1 MAG: hypothetical protein A3E92_00410 [Candidatus Taylorbacteria bacterium RIFCSPHIGHO2_12_FULL_42_34]OHA30605.1 MAG: hypothetical protein A3B09_00290 [Candidatus Taylorbacteria bacterium RIFCSPLOWO2_01_FULL_43_83]OHA38502.1 MAG: hypothetical protein A3H58_02935 [Candi
MAHKYPVRKFFASNYSILHGQVIKHKRVAKYVISGTIAAAANIALLFLLTDIMRFWYLSSAVISFMFGVIVSFVLQKYWTFEDNRASRIKSQFAVYVAIAIGGAIINTALVYSFVEIAGLWYLLAQIFSGVVIAVVNFFCYCYLVFNK